MNELKTIRSWYEAGIINADAATLAENPKYRACYVAQGWSLAADTTWGPGMGVDAVAVQWGPTVMGSDTIQGSMNCISASSKNPEKALQLLELVNTDSYVRDSRSTAWKAKTGNTHRWQAAQNQDRLAHGWLHPGQLLHPDPAGHRSGEPGRRDQGSERGCYHVPPCWALPSTPAMWLTS